MPKKYALRSFLTVGQLKELIAGMSDDALVLARDRDIISLEQVHIVGHAPKCELPVGGDPWVRCYAVAGITDVYGGDDFKLSNKSQQAIVFCDCG